MDVFLYNGEMKRRADLRFIEYVAEHKSSNECLIVLVTPGGDPDAAYKMARYLQHKYDKFSVLVSGFCKSAGTLFAIGAYELIFAPYGELGPLDVQLSKTDHLASLESGLNISEALYTLETRARETFIGVTLDLIGSSSGVVSFQTASHSASEIVGALYGPVFARIDPEEVGSRSRAMRIGADYGKRLNLKWNNLKPDSLDLLSQTYSSHGFVIDSLEAKELFTRVRMASEDEMALVEELKEVARYPQRSLTIRKLRNIATATEKGEDDDEAAEADDQDEAAADTLDGGDTEAAVEAEHTAPGGNEASQTGE